MKNVCNDRIIVLELKAEPASISFVQVCMPTSKYEDDQVDEMYTKTEEILEEDRKGETNTIKMGDWNGVAGDKSYRNTAGPHGPGRISQRGQTLIDVYEMNSLVITNTQFKKTKRRLYTWKAPEQSQHQCCILACSGRECIIDFALDRSEA